MESTENRTAAVVVTWNRKDLLQQNIKCLLGQEGAECDILIFDNASTDGTAEMVEREFDDARLKYFNTGANLGGAGGFHVGIYQAVMLGYDYVWIMDDDSLPEPNALAELFRAGESVGDWGFLSSAVYWTDGSLCEANRPKKDLFRHIGDKDLSGEPVPVRMGSFVSMLVHSDVIREVGLPIAEYFIWTDDYEFSGRISKLHPCYFVPRSRVTHAMASNTRANLVTAEGDRAGRFRNLYRNDVHCYRQHGVEGLAYLAAKGAYTAADVVLHAESDKRERLKALADGFLSGASFKPDVVHIHGDKTRVLIYTDAWGRGGIESFVMETLRHINRSKFDISIFSPWDTGEDCFGDELRQMGIQRKSLQIGRPSNLKRGVLDVPLLSKTYDLSQFDVFHANTTTVIGLSYCREAKLKGVRRVIAHSHNSAFGSGWEFLKQPIHDFGQRKLVKYADVLLACSMAAGQYLFGDASYRVIKNGIDIKRFSFDEANRKRIRDELNIPQDAFVVGNIGRLADEKNPIFQIEVFAKLHEKIPDAFYIMVGSGPLDDEVAQAIREYNVADAVKRVPMTSKPEDYYSAIDVMLFPSKFEGMPITTVEAQCNGLPVLAADHLPKEIAVTELISWESLEAESEEWVKDLMSIRETHVNRKQYADVVAERGYSSAELAVALEHIYEDRL